MTFQSLCRSCSGALAIGAGICVLLGSVASVQAQTVVLDDPFESTLVAGGEYKVGNNVWGASTDQEVTVNTNTGAFEVTLSDHDQNNVAAYPFIYKGYHWGDGTPTDNGMPKQIQDVASAPFEWSVDTSAAGGEWNAAFESWYSTSGGTPPNAAELMIWVDSQGPYGPGGSYVDTVTIGGLEWNLYHATGWGSWNHYIAYQLTSTSPSGVTSVSLDLVDFHKDSLARGFLLETYYLDAMEAGFEIWSDGEGLKSNSYSADAFAFGDVNGDNTIDTLDIAPFNSVLTGSSSYSPMADMDDSGVVDALDIAPFSAALAGDVQVIPEPGAAAMLALGALVLTRRRRAS